MLAITASQYPSMLRLIAPSVGKAFLRQFHAQRKGHSVVLQAVRRSLCDRSFTSHGKIQFRRTTALIHLDIFKMNNFAWSIHPTMPILLRYMSSNTPGGKGDGLESNKMKSSKEKIDFEAWKTSSAQQSILGAITSVNKDLIEKLIFKLILGLVIDLVLLIYRLLRTLIGDKGKKIIDGAAKTGAGAEIKKSVEKTKEIAARELPKLNEKLEKSIPVAKQNMKNFSSKLDQEISSAKTGEEKFSRVMEMIGDLTKTNRPFQIFIAFLIGMFVLQVLQFFFWKEKESFDEFYPRLIKA